MVFKSPSRQLRWPGGLLLAPQLVDEGNGLLDERLDALIERIRQKPVRCDDRQRLGLDRVAKRLWDAVAQRACWRPSCLR